MSDASDKAVEAESLFDSAVRYDRSINWSARLSREVPVLVDVFGPPGPAGLIDAGCGTGRQSIALTELGYRLVGIDSSEEMLKEARRLANEAGAQVELVCVPYGRMHERIGGGFDGVYCLGSALTAVESREDFAEAIQQFGRCLRIGGRLFIQILNFAPMRSQEPCVRGPRVATVGGREYVSVRQYHFLGEHVEVTNVTLWQDKGWKQWARSGRLYAAGLDELRGCCRAAHLRIDAEWGGYDRHAFDIEKSSDLLIAATRV
jgi:SAM-dependent methyltransferase